MYSDDDAGYDAALQCDESKPRCVRCASSGFACVYASPSSSRSQQLQRKTTVAPPGPASGSSLSPPSRHSSPSSSSLSAAAANNRTGVLRLELELNLDLDLDLNLNLTLGGGRKARQMVWAPLEPQRRVPVVLPLAVVSSALRCKAFALDDGGGGSYELRPRDLAALQRFVDRTAWTFGDTSYGGERDEEMAMVPFGGGGGERRRNWYSEAALGLGNSNPFLLHIFIAVALLHDMHLAGVPASSNSSTGDAAAAAQQRARLAFHWYHGTALFQRQLASVTAVMSACNYDGSKAPSSSARDALWVAAALLGAAAYADVGSGGEIPDSTDERPGARDSRMTRRTKTQGKPQRQRQRHLVWPLRPGSHPSDLDWLKLGHGKTAVWHVADPSRPESVFHRLGESLARDPPPDGHLPVDWDALPPLFARVFSPAATSSSPSSLSTSPSSTSSSYSSSFTGADSSSDSRDSSGITNPYHVPLSILAQLFPQRASDRNVSRFLTFVAQLPAPFRRLLERRDPRALLLLAYWHAKVARRPSWWVCRRSVVEGLAICDYLAGPRCRDAAGPDVVALLEWPRRELLEVQARDTTCW